MIYQVRMHPTLDILVSSIGEVFAPDQHGKYRWVAGSRSGDGYIQITINKVHYKVHRLVAETFLSNPEAKPEVDHINRSKGRGWNTVDNLRWVTKEENRRNRSDVEDVTSRVIPHNYEDKKAYHRAHRKEYVTKNPENAVRWFKTHKKVRVSDGSYKYFPNEMVQQLLKLPVKDRVIYGV